MCQCSKIPDWLAHFRRFYPFPVFDLTQKERLEEYMRTAEKCAGVINYDLVFRRENLKNLSGFTLVLDESSLIQNERTKRSKFILGLKPENVVLLSGTPTSGKYERLWSQCRLLGWKISKALFWKQYVCTEWAEIDGAWRPCVAGYKNVDRLKEKLREHGAIFMTTEEAGLALPEKIITRIETPTPPSYSRFLEKHRVTVNPASPGANANCQRELIGDIGLTRFLYARQLCGLYNPARYEAFRDLIDGTEDRLIVFYNFTGELALMEEIARTRHRPVSILSGGVKDLSAYQSRPDSITFIQYQAGSKGGNFQLANKIIYFSLPLSCEDWMQSQKRIHRIGQKKTCFYYLMICPRTIEEKILDALERGTDYTLDLFEKEAKNHDPM